MIGRLQMVVLDCPEPKALAAFYSEVLGLRVSDEDDEWVTLGGATGGPSLAFQRSPGYQPPSWPDPAASQQLHLDVEVDDVEVAEPRVLALGARRLAGGGQKFRVYADPVGHPFCLVWN